MYIYIGIMNKITIELNLLNIKLYKKRYYVYINYHYYFIILIYYTINQKRKLKIKLIFSYLNYV